MAARLLYYNPNVVNRAENQALPGISRFSQLFKVINRTVSLVDRSETIHLPVRLKSLFPIPEFQLMKKTFEELCNERANELLTQADQLGSTLYVFWSGGIDSTLALVSLLANATAAQKANIVVLLSEESIAEYPKFYQDYIYAKLRVDSAIMFPYLLGSKHLIINGELNDQLFGSDMLGKMIIKFGPSVIHQTYNRDTLLAFFDEHVNNKEITNFYLDLFERLIGAAPVKIQTHADYLWWINFSMKWQAVFMRTLSYATKRNVSNINSTYIQRNYAPFFCTDSFQLWSMNNLDKRIKSTWPTYKWICKDIIYSHTKDSDYRDNKSKRGSLYFLLLQQTSYNFIDESMFFFQDLSSTEYHDSENDFV